MSLSLKILLLVWICVIFNIVILRFLKKELWIKYVVYELFVGVAYTIIAVFVIGV